MHARPPVIASLLISLLLWLPLSAHASHATDAGVQWLSATQNADGYWGNSFGGTPLRDTTAVVGALKELSPGSINYSRAIQWLLGTNPLALDYVSRRISALAETGNDLTGAQASLRAAQHADGGWGLDADHESDILDTALALRAHAATNTTDGVAPAVGFLLSRQQADGSWPNSEGQPSVFVTAQAFRALWTYRNNYVGVSAALGKAQTFLISQQDASGTWGENFDTALALIALIPQVTDLSVIKASVAALQNAQLANGSWNDDSYTTALALQALRLYELRQGVGLVQNGSISGYVLKAGSTEPIAGATVTLNELPGISVLSNADGYFIFTGLPAGTYTISASKSGYSAASLVASAQPNQVTLGGSLVLGVADQTGLVRGKVFDAANLLPLSGALVSLGSYSASTNANGEFDFGALPVGGYSVAVAKNGYYTVNGSATLAAGQTLTVNQGLTKEGAFQDTNPAAVSGAVIDAKTGLPLAGALLDLGGGLAATTAANGQFTIASVPRGNYTATLSAAGYVTQTYSIAFPAGALGNLGTLSLYPSASTTAPTALTLNGLVVDGVTRAPITGASVTLVETGATAATGTDGRFVLDGITLKSFTLSLSASGYQSSTVGMQVAAFGTAEATLALSPPGSGATASTLQGTVKDATTGAPIAGATVQIVGTGFSTTAGSDGRYSLNGIDLLQFAVSVSAVGYAQQSQPIQLASHGSYALDPLLSPIAGDSFTVVSVLGPPAATGANGTALFTANIASLLPAQKSALVLGEILDAGGASVAKVIPYAEGTTIPTAEFSFNAGEVKTLTVPWTTGQFPPGAYKLVLRVVEPGTINAAVPWGQIHAEGGAYTGIVETQAIGGALALNPPLIQAGQATPVSISALVSNAGNTPLVSGAYALVVTRADTGASLYTTETAAGAIDVGQYINVDFGQWVPTEAGNLVVTVRAKAAGVAGAITDELYVGDKASGTFTVNKNVVPEGTQTVHGKISMQGVDTSKGGSTDPLYKLVQSAVKKGGQYTAPGAVSWHKSGRCLGCHIQTQSLYGLASSIGKADVDTNATKFLYNAIAGSLQATGALYISHPEYAKTQTTLGFWSLTAWPEIKESFRTLYFGAKYLFDRKVRTGDQTYWTPDYSQGWWNNNISHTALTVLGFAELLNNSGQLDMSQIQDYSLGAGVGLGAGTNPLDIETGPDGAVYIAKYSGSVVRLDTATNQVTTAVSGLPANSAYGVAFGQDGTIYVSGYKYLRKVLSNGTTQEILTSNGYFTDVELGPDGLLYIADFSNHRILRINSTGQAEVFAGGGLFSNPYGLAFDAAGNLLVANYGGYNVLKVAADKTVSVFSDGLAFHPLWLDVTSEGVAYVSTTTPDGLYRIGVNGVAERLISVSMLRGVLVKNGKILVGNQTANTLHELQAAPLNTSLLASYRGEIPRAARYFLGNYKDNSTDNTIQALRLWGMAEARSVITDATLKSQLDTAIAYADNLLRSRQRADGGWTRYQGQPSDPLVTAMVGLALEYSDPSPDDAVVRNTIQYLLNAQQADGSWLNVNNGLSTRLAATSFVMAYLPKALERLGGIDIDLHLDLPASITLSNPTITPTATLPGADGGKEYVWKLLGVTNAGRNVEFDLTLADMQLRETRPVARSAYLEFANSFVTEKVRLDLEVPQVTAASEMVLAVSTDKTSYLANEPAIVSTTVTNAAPTTASGQVQLVIRAPGDPTPLVEFPPIPVDNLASGAQVVYATNWNTASTLAGGYEAYGRLLDTQGRLLNESLAPFTIGAPASLAATGVTTDKQIYDAWDSVNINGRVQNTATNAILPASRVEITVKNPAGETLYFDSRQLGEMAPGALTDLPFGLRLSDAATGQYPVTLALKDEFTRAVLSTSTTTFQVQRRALQGVVGAVQVTAPQVYIGDPDACTETAKNVSATMVSGLRLIHQLVNMDAAVVVDEISEVVDLPAGGVVHSYFRNIDTSTLALGGYACVIKADLDGEVRTLAFGGFNVIEPPIKAVADLHLGTKGRLLVLLDGAKSGCADERESDHDADDGGTDHDRKSGDTDDDRDDEDGGDCEHGSKPASDLDPHGPKDALLLSAQRAFLEALLKKAGWSYTIVETAKDFTRELRTGGYSVYALFAEHVKLSTRMQKELREAVYRGEGLLVAGAHDERHHHLTEALGVKHIGHVSHATGVALAPSPLNLSGEATLLPRDKALRARRVTAQVLATYVLVSGHGHEREDDDCQEHPASVHSSSADGMGRDHDEREDACDGHPERYLDAATLNAYGDGRAIFVGFDLLATATRDGETALLSDVLRAALGEVNPRVPSRAAGAVAPLELVITNQGIAAPIRVTLALPEGFAVMDAPGAQASNNTLVWNAELAEDGTMSFVIWVRLPLTAGNTTLKATVEASWRDNYRVVAEPTLNLVVELAPAPQDILAMLGALGDAGTSDRERLKQAHKHVEKAARYAADQPDKALYEALKATDILLATDPAETAPIRIELDGWIRWVEMQIQP